RRLGATRPVAYAGPRPRARARVGASRRDVGLRARRRARAQDPLELAAAVAMDRAAPWRARHRACELLGPRPRARPGRGTAARARTRRDARDLAVDHGKGDEMKLGLL